MDILIVEDEILIAETISLYLRQRDYTVSSICISYDEAIMAIQQKTPDLVLLDIRLYGEKSGIDIAHYINSLPRPIPFVYLTSQFDEQVLDLALEAKPAGYLTKPIQKSTLYTTLKAVERLHYVTTSNAKSFSVFDGHSTQVLQLSNILYVKVDHVYLEIHMQDGSAIITRESLSKFADRLGEDFMQVHRSFIINFRQVVSWTKTSAVLTDNTSVPISRSNSIDFQQAMNSRK